MDESRVATFLRQVTVISVTPPVAATSGSRDSLDQDSGHPESEVTTTTSRGASRSPSDYRSLDCDRSAQFFK